ncbi:hypothetical protein QFC20_007121 [Naganishia adeliensis]|uniref:Uncharacterized protein n=1 Tax=Naganishia adeliensis TaxID=92952 RepID=A0ACC2V4G7_9TREE|nr:hypothetical protein QFC20_007121 [Naganishia adeliensis]
MTGTVNQNAAVAVRVVKIAQETMIEGIIRAVFDASLRKAPIEKYAECITGMFVPVIVYLSIMNLAIWLAGVPYTRLPIADVFGKTGNLTQGGALRVTDASFAAKDTL